MTVCQSGDEIIAANNLYGGTIGSLSGTMQEWDLLLILLSTIWILWNLINENKNDIC